MDNNYKITNSLPSWDMSVKDCVICAQHNFHYLKEYWTTYHINESDFLSDSFSKEKVVAVFKLKSLKNA